MNYQVGLSVPAFSNAGLLGNEVQERQPVDDLGPRFGDDGHASGTLHIDGDGVIFDCSRGAASLLGRAVGDLVGDVIWHIVPALERRRLISDSRVDPHLAFLCHCGVTFRVVRPNGAAVPCRMFVHSLSHNGGPALRLILRDESGQRPNICL